GARGVDLGLDEHLGPVGLLLGREVRQRGAAVLGDQHGQGAGEAGVVVGGDLVGDVVLPVVGVGVVRGAGAAHQRPVEHVPVVGGRGDAVGPRAVRGAVVGVARRVGAEAHHVAGVARVVAQGVVDLPDAEVVVALAADRVVGDRLGVHQRGERGVGGVAQRPPGVEDGLAARRVGHALAVHADRPVVEPPVGVVEVLLLAGLLGQQHVGAVGLVVPGDRPPVAADVGLLLGGQEVVLVLGLVQVGGVTGGLVQPVGAPDQLVLVAGPGVVEGPGGHAVGVLAAVGVGEGVELLGVLHQGGGVGGVVVGEHDRGGGHRRGGLGGHVAARAGGVDLVAGALHRHDLGRTPPLVVGVAVADLGVQHVGGGVGLDEVVVDPAQVGLEVGHLAGERVALGALDRAPGEHGGGEGHGQAELDVVARVVPAAGQV